MKSKTILFQRLKKENYIVSFDYFDKSLIFLSVTSGSISIASFTTVIGTPVGISGALMNNQISHKDFMTIINEERNYRELKEKIRMMKCQEDKNNRY